MYRSQVKSLGEVNGLLNRKVALLESENDRLRGLVAAAETRKAAEQSAAWRHKIEADVEEIRGLKFREPVVYAVVTRKEIKDVVSKKMSEVFSAEDFTAISGALARLGLLPPGYDLRKKYIELLGEQIAAFYDQHRHKLFMFEDASLESVQNQVILAHELTHALQDQNYDLLKFPLEIKDNDDRSLAASALIEGDATLVMSQYMMKHLSLRALKENVGSALTQNTEQIAQAPRYLREMLLFPYLRGQEFCLAITAEGGFPALARCYRKLPASTAEILHPARFGEPAPPGVAWAKTDFDGHPPGESNVVGEAVMRIHLAAGLEEVAAEKLAAHARGDRYLFFAQPESLVWKTVWENPEAATEFAAAERQVLEKRYGALAWQTEGEVARAEGPRHLRLRSNPPGTVVLIDASSAGDADRLLQQFAP
jgi:hypothetical protein